MARQGCQLVSYICRRRKSVVSGRRHGRPMSAFRLERSAVVGLVLGRRRPCSIVQFASVKCPKSATVQVERLRSSFRQWSMILPENRFPLFRIML
jgi:hypothetical protein